MAGLGSRERGPERHAGFAHPRPATEHNQVGRLEPAKALLHDPDSHREPQEPTARLIGFLDAGKGHVRSGAYRAEF